MKKLAPILVSGITSLLLVHTAYRGFVTGEKGLVFVSMAFAVICILGCWLVIRGVNRKDKELAERNRREDEVFQELEKPLQLKTPESKDSTEEKQKG